MSGTVRIKICGIKTPEDARAAVEAGADLIQKQVLDSHSASELKNSSPPNAKPARRVETSAAGATPAPRKRWWRERK